MTFFEKIALHAPFRMALGKLGIRLVAIGRNLQIRYANWNDEFRLKFKETKGGLGDFHVSEPLITEFVLSFHCPNSQPEKKTPLVDALFAVQGVSEISLYRYSIRIEKAEVYDWTELRPQIEAIILRELTTTK